MSEMFGGSLRLRGSAKRLRAKELDSAGQMSWDYISAGNLTATKIANGIAMGELGHGGFSTRERRPGFNSWHVTSAHRLWQ
ncbi:hypothetical protein IG631_19215 [Alternaria alternata]|jgi:cytochrome bd-type quinol oxidase subunit 2|nr:hypothetical protein IG631_19215 [Alternaria alternata]